MNGAGPNESLPAGGPTVVVGPSTRLDDLDVAEVGPVVTHEDLQGAHTLRVHGIGDGLWIRGRTDRWSVLGWGFLLAEPGATPDAGWTTIDGQAVADRLDAHGIDALPTFHGSHVLVVVDRDAGRVYFMGDPSQVRRWNLWSDGELTVASTKPTRVASVLGGLPENVAARDYFLVYAYHPGETTMYEGITRPLGGVVHTIGQEGIERVALGEPPATPTIDAASSSFEVAVDELHDVLMASMRAQTRGMQRAAVLLGGFDSALVAALGVRAGLEVETYTFRYGDERYDQPMTDVLAETLGITHHWVDVGAATVRDGLQRYGDVFDAPTNWANYPIQTVEVAEAIARGDHDIVLTGDGCDATFYGYPGVYTSYRVGRRLPSLPAGAVSRINGLLARSPAERWAGHPARLAMRLLRVSSYPEPERWYFMYRFMDEASIARLTGEPQDAVEARVGRAMARVAESIPTGSPTRLTYAGKNATAPSKVKLTGAGDVAGLALFSPYMHPAVGSLVKGYPDEWLRPPDPDPIIKSIGKYVLVRMAQKYELLPDDVILQPKLAAVDAPVEEWYRGAVRPTVEQLLADLPFDADPQYLDDLFATKRLETLYASRFSSDSLTSHALMLLATYGAYFGA